MIVVPEWIDEEVLGVRTVKGWVRWAGFQEWWEVGKERKLAWVWGIRWTYASECVMKRRNRVWDPGWYVCAGSYRLFFSTYQSVVSQDVHYWTGWLMHPLQGYHNEYSKSKKFRPNQVRCGQYQASRSSDWAICNSRDPRDFATVDDLWRAGQHPWQWVNQTDKKQSRRIKWQHRCHAFDPFRSNSQRNVRQSGEPFPTVTVDTKLCPWHLFWLHSFCQLPLVIIRMVGESIFGNFIISSRIDRLLNTLTNSHP